MRKTSLVGVALFMLICLPNFATADVNVNIGLPNLSIGINVPVFPELDPIPGYPVYYAPEVPGNFFFYDGLYWVYYNDAWYASSWYNGPWYYVDPFDVPLFILRVPVTYYRQPPVYFRQWRPDAPPRWGEHWGHSWEKRRSGWDHWKRGTAPRPAPLPVYQRQYAGNRYPRVEQQPVLRKEHYRYQPHDRVVRQVFKQTGPKAAQRGGREKPQAGNPRKDTRPTARQPIGPAGQRAPQLHRGGENAHRQAPGPSAPQQGVPAAHEPRRQSGPVSAPQEHRQPGSPVHEQRQAPPPRQELRQPSPPHPERRQAAPPHQEHRQPPTAAPHEPQGHEQQRGQGQRPGPGPAQERGKGQEHGQGHNKEGGGGRYEFGAPERACRLKVNRRLRQMTWGSLASTPLSERLVAERSRRGGSELSLKGGS